jgi:hypothetical protein
MIVSSIRDALEAWELRSEIRLNAMIESEEGGRGIRTRMRMLMKMRNMMLWTGDGICDRLTAGGEQYAWSARDKGNGIEYRKESGILKLSGEAQAGGRTGYRWSEQVSAFITSKMMGKSSQWGTPRRGGELRWGPHCEYAD